mgnify:CR=1 FL=1
MLINSIRWLTAVFGLVTIALLVIAMRVERKLAPN